MLKCGHPRASVVKVGVNTHMFLAKGEEDFRIVVMLLLYEFIQRAFISLL